MSRWISGEQWPVASQAAYLTSVEHSGLALASASTMLGAEASSVKSSAYDVMSESGIGQSDTKWLKRAGEMTDPCGTFARTWREGKWWYSGRYDLRTQFFTGGLQDNTEHSIAFSLTVYI